MSQTIRMFAIIQLLRRTDAALTAREIAETLEVTTRTIYRDIAALQAMRVPIEGAAGIGYLMRPGFDLPPLMFTSEEVEAIVVGLALLGRTGDAGLLAAARSVGRKLADVLPGDGVQALKQSPLHASVWNAIPDASVDPGMLRQAIRAEAAVRLTYIGDDGTPTRRAVKPLALIYYIEAVVLAAWCELRRDFRHFRLDRIRDCAPTGSDFHGEGAGLRARWSAQRGLP